MPKDGSANRKDQSPKYESGESDAAAANSENHCAVQCLREAATRLTSLSRDLKGQVSPETVREIEFFARFALATANKHTEIEEQFEKLRALQEARVQALEALLSGKAISLTDGEEKEVKN